MSWEDVAQGGFIPTADMVNSPRADVRASQVANLANLLRWVIGYIEQIRTAGGVAPLSDDTPSTVADTSVAGSSDEGSRSDHVHAGVASVSKTALVRGDVTFSGDGVTQTGNDFSIPGDGEWDYDPTFTPTGDPKVFTLPSAYEQETVHLVVDGITLEPGYDFTVVGTTLTFLGNWNVTGRRYWIRRARFA